MALQGKRVLITGGAGFIGSTLARRLVDANQVVLYDNLTRDALRHTDLAAHPNVESLHGDILDADALAAAADGRDAHRAHGGHRRRGLRAQEPGAHDAGQPARHRQRARGRGRQPRDGLERFIDFSTSEVFGRHAYKVEETHETSGGSVGEARWTYAVSKLAGEYLAHSYFDEMGLPTAVIRPFNIYGPNQVGSGAIHHFTVRGLAGDELIIHGDGSQIRAWCYIDDIVAAILEILESPNAVGQAFNIGNPRSVCTTYDLALRIRRLTGDRSPLVFRPLHYSDVEIRIPDITKSRELLKWEPQVDLDEGLERTLAWYQSRSGAA